MVGWSIFIQKKSINVYWKIEKLKFSEILWNFSIYFTCKCNNFNHACESFVKFDHFISQMEFFIMLFDFLFQNEKLVLVLNLFIFQWKL